MFSGEEDGGVFLCFYKQYLTFFVLFVCLQLKHVDKAKIKFKLLSKLQPGVHWSKQK